MTGHWFFQANPERYDIDGALASLRLIRWRVPQHTAEIHPGDAVLIWRSNPDAGIVGVGRVLEPPKAMARLEEETPFARTGEEISEVTTRVPLEVRTIPFIAKDQVAALPSFREHPIITAPMMTVYPLDATQWTELKRLLPETLPFDNEIEIEFRESPPRSVRLAPASERDVSSTWRIQRIHPYSHPNPPMGWAGTT